MRGNRVLILGILLMILAGVLVVKVIPQWKQYLASQKNKSAAGGQVVHPAKLSSAVCLKDGSFNPVPPLKAPVSDDPAALVARTQWRERYRSALLQTQPPQSAPAFYVYPFLDGTPEGVGMQCTYGWRLVGEAALAQWTDARLVSAAEPRDYGLPRIDEGNPARQWTQEEWLRRALEDPATKDARYVITGIYGYDAQAKQYGLQIKLLDRQAPSASQDLATTSSLERGDYVQLAATQRAIARAMTGKLIALGLAHARPEPQAKGIKLEKELGQVAMLLDAGDSWAMMDGIDRALALAQLFPRETLPLQAAAYGLNALGWSYLSYADTNVYRHELSLRSHALTQVALAMDSRPLLSRLNWARACVDMGYSYRVCLGPSLSKPDFRDLAPELLNYRNTIIWNHAAKLSPEELAKLPNWQNLWSEAASSWFITDNGNRELYAKALPCWDSHDLYLQALLQGYIKRYNHVFNGQNMNHLRALGTASAYATAGTLAAELAATLTALGPCAETDDLLERLDIIVKSVSSGKDGLKDLFNATPGLDRQRLGTLIQARDYYGLRQLFIKTLAPWGAPADGSHPAYRVLAEMENALPKVMQAPQAASYATVFVDFEFCPARRAQFTGWRDLLGPRMLAKLAGDTLGVYEDLREVATAYLRVRPTNAAALAIFSEHFKDQARQPKADELREAEVKDQYGLYPLDTKVLFELGGIHYNAGRHDLGLAYLAAYTRQAPFVTVRNLYLGRFYRDHAYHAKAVKYLGEFVKDHPARYDIANERAWSLCQMGRWLDPEVRAAFARPAPILTGNSSFHEDNLNYLVYWAKDYKAAREAAKLYMHCASGSSVNPTVWMASIEKEDGQTSKGLEILQRAQVPRVSNLQEQGNIYANMADAFLDFDRPDLAKPYTDQAAKTDNWMGNVIVTMGNQAYGEGDYDRAIKEFERCIDRYGFNTDCFGRILSCMEKQGKLKPAIEMLEDKLRDDPQDIYVGLRLRLMRYYSEAGMLDKMKPLMDQILKSPSRQRHHILDAAKFYKKAQPKLAEEIERGIDQIMAGPEG